MTGHDLKMIQKGKKHCSQWLAHGLDPSLSVLARLMSFVAVAKAYCTKLEWNG